MRDHMSRQLIDQKNREVEAVVVTVFCVEVAVVVPPLHFVEVGGVVARKLDQNLLGACRFVPVVCRLIGGEHALFPQVEGAVTEC